MALLAFVLGLVPALQEVRARWRCEPEAVAVGEPFVLVLELEHPAELPARELAAGELTLDASWVVLGEESLASTLQPDGTLRTRRAWSVAALEPGEHALSAALSSFALSERVTRIQVGEAKVRVNGLLAKDEDAPRPLREFPDDFADESEGASARRSPWWIAALGLALASGVGLFFWLRQRARRTAAATPLTPQELLEQLARDLEDGRGRERCYELTRLLRATTDAARRKDRAGLTDEEWLAELGASLEVPRGAVQELERVFQRAWRVKYAGDPATPWALGELFEQARGALRAVGALPASTPSGGARP
ncbi:MAG: hypothetical protein EXS08_13400 [Planctomycetes bacterium]|nr:hypothetical protein [Planctomycetota bacterium]